MDFLIVALVAALASALTLYSGFGLGTILLPVFALFFPVELAVAATAVVHAANNVLKVSLLGRLADRAVVLRFGVPAIIAAFVGAWVLSVFTDLPDGPSWQVLGLSGTLSPVNLLIAVLMAGFAFLELSPRFQGRDFGAGFLPVGGALSGFFGGLSGHQGALRSAFLATTRITAEGFVGTNAVIGLAVDVVRILVYGLVVFGGRWGQLVSGSQGGLVLTGTLAAFAGVIIGKRLLHKVTMEHVRKLTGVMLLVIALLLGAGLL